METLEEIVNKYHIELCGENLKVLIDKEDKKGIDVIKSNKQKIIDFLKNKKNFAEKESKFLKNLKNYEAIKEEAKKRILRQIKIDDAMDNEDVITGLPDIMDDAEFEKLKKEAPNTMFVFKLIKQKNGLNCELSTIAEECYNLLINGESFETTKKIYDKKMEENYKNIFGINNEYKKYSKKRRRE